jgi:hypothetical protein
MNKKTLFFLMTFLAVAGVAFMEQLPSDIEGYHPPNGFVPDKETAKRIAEAIWLPIYGRVVLSQKPYEVILIDDRIWIVEGTTRSIFARGGGTAYIEIDKYTGAILKVAHGK